MDSILNRAFRFLIAAVLAAVMATAVAGESRGLRTNNPGNIIKTSIVWQGVVECPDKVNECFISPDYGIRAMAVILNTYYTRHQLRTIDAVIERWGPAGAAKEEIRNNYIRLVNGSYIKYACDVPVKEVYVHLIRAIIHFENGSNPFSEDYIRRIVYDTVRTDNHAWECPDWRYAQIMGDEGTRKESGAASNATSVRSAVKGSEGGKRVFKSRLPMDQTIPSNNRSFSDFSVAKAGSIIRHTSNSWVERVPSGIPIHGRQRNHPMENNDRSGFYTVRHPRFNRRVRYVLWRLTGRTQQIGE